MTVKHKKVFSKKRLFMSWAQLKNTRPLEIECYEIKCNKKGVNGFPPGDITHLSFLSLL